MSFKPFLICTLCLIFVGENLPAQQQTRRIKQHIVSLSAGSMHGRGYVNKGVNKAANYISRNFSELGLQPFVDSSYYQHFTFPVNTFPDRLRLQLGRQELQAGADYLIDPASTRVDAERLRVKRLKLKSVRDTAQWEAALRKLNPGRAWLLQDLDTVLKYLKVRRRWVGQQLPEGLYLVPEANKLTWSVSTDTIAPTIFYIRKARLPKRVCRVSAVADAKWVKEYGTQNVVGFVPGTEQPDSFIVFTAHYDHLGRMGRNSIFPGAHDNASGTALMLHLAAYFAANPQPYSIAFMAFSAEEAGLIGSRYYTEHPLFPLEQIRFLVNLDMTGNARDGITVVNATDQKEAFGLLQKINEEGGFLKAVNERSQAANSDHYFFSQKGVPAVFIYGLGAKGHYHDIYDKASELSLEKIDQLALLLIDFAKALQ